MLTALARAELDGGAVPAHPAASSAGQAWGATHQACWGYETPWRTKPAKPKQPTQRRLEKAREEGQFPAAKEFVAALQFLVLSGAC